MKDSIVSISSGVIRLNKSRVIENINLNVIKGSVNYLIGENGAGKSVVFDLICGYSGLQSGRLQLSLDKEYIVYFPQTMRYPQNLTVKECISYYCILMNDAVISDWSQFFEKEIFDVFNKIKDQKINKCSLGEVKIIFLNLLINSKQGELFVFDEPYAGLSVKNVNVFNRVIQQRISLGKTFLISTHLTENLIEDANVIYL